MDVEAEFRAADRSIRRQIDARAQRALDSLAERWPVPSDTSPALVVEAPRDPFEAWGQLARAFNDAIGVMVASLRRGYTAVDRATNHTNGSGR